MSEDFRGRKIIDLLLYLYLNETFGGGRSLAELGRVSGYKGPGGYYDALNSLLNAGYIKRVKGEYIVTSKGKRFLRIDKFLKTFYILGLALAALGLYYLYIIFWMTTRLNIDLVFTSGLALVVLGSFLVVFPRIYYWIEFTRRI